MVQICDITQDHLSWSFSKVLIYHVPQRATWMIVRCLSFICIFARHRRDQIHFLHQPSQSFTADHRVMSSPQFAAKCPRPRHMSELFDDLDHLFLDLLIAACLLARHRILIFPFPFVISARAALHDPAQTVHAEPRLLLIFLAQRSISLIYHQKPFFFVFGACDMIRLASNSNCFFFSNLMSISRYRFLAL